MKKKITAMLLCALMLTPALASCANTTPPTETTTLAGDGNPEDTQEVLVLPENMHYDGATFNVLTAGNVAYNDFMYDDSSAGVNVVSEAQYHRLMLMEETYGVKVTEERKQDNKSYGEGPGYRSLALAVSSESDTYQLGIIGGYDVANLARNNYLYDLNSMPWIDTSKSWWDQNANQDLSIKGLLLFTNGALTAAYSESTFCFYFNKDLAKECLTDEQNPYNYVKAGNWTIDKLGELSRLASKDLDGNTLQNYHDRFGIYTWDDSMIGMVEAAGTKICTIVKDGSVLLTLNDTKTVNMINKYADFAYNGEYALAYQAEMRAGNMNTDSVYGSWAEGKALFWASSTNNLPRIRTLDGDFGILPYPKLTEDQDRYYSTIAPYNSQFICVPLYLEDDEFVGSVVEALAYHGKEIVTPAVYEKTLKGAYARDEESYDMLDIIFGSYGYDFGLYYRVGMYPDMLLNLLRNKSTAFASKYGEAEGTAESELRELNAHFKELIDYWDARED